MSSEPQSNLVATMGAIAGIGLLAVGGVSLFAGLDKIGHPDPINALAAAACFVASAMAFGIVFWAVIRK